MTPPVSDRTLRRYLAGALDPGRREEIEAALAASSALRERLGVLMATTVSMEASPWRLPPVGARGAWSLSSTVQAGAAMGDEEEGLVAGDYVELRFQPPEGHGEHRLALMRRSPLGEWEVLFPSGPSEERRVAALPHDTEGRVRLDVAVEAPGPLLLAVALLPPDVAIAWEAPEPARWAEVQAALDQGRVPVETLVFGKSG